MLAFRYLGLYMLLQCDHWFLQRWLQFAESSANVSKGLGSCKYFPVCCHLWLALRIVLCRLKHVWGPLLKMVTRKCFACLSTPKLMLITAATMWAVVFTAFLADYVLFARKDPRCFDAGLLRSLGQEPYFDRGCVGANASSRNTDKRDSRHSQRGQKGVMPLLLQFLAPRLLC